MTTEPPPEGEITCLVTDVEGSTVLSKELTAAQYRQCMAEHDRLLNACFAEHGGTVVDNPGDGFFVTFHHIRDALRCAIAIQESLARNRDSLFVGEGDGERRDVQVGIGVYKAVQEVFLTPAGKYANREINLAARIGACGVGGQIIVNDRAYEAGAASLQVQWKHHDNRYVRDFDTPQTLHELLWDERTDRQEPGARWTPKFLLREGNAFVGREKYLKEIVQWLKSDRPLIVLHGQGGVGKTRLVGQAVLAVGSHYRGRIYGVALDQEFSGNPESVTPIQLAARIAVAVDAPENVRNSEDPATLVDHLAKRFATDAFLLVLDNFESVNNDATRQFLADLARRVPKLRCLVTCRTLFQLGALSQSLEVQGMKIPPCAEADLDSFEGYRLFRERALQHDPPAQIDDSESLVRILGYTEGNALGIELTAARGVDFSLKRIADGLQESLLNWQRVLKEVGDSSGGVQRHESMEACLDWSFQLLPEEQRALYPRLGIFPADFDACAAQAIAGISEEMLLSWSRWHLVQRNRETERCALQPVLREFAEGRQTEVDRDTLHDKFAPYYAALAEANGDMNNAVHRRTLGAELRNLYAAADHLCEHSTNMPDNTGALISLGLALYHVPIGVRTDNLRKAISCYEVASRGFTQGNHSVEWAMTQNNLAVAYNNLPSGDVGENLYSAIAYYEAELSVYTQSDFPNDWALIQNNLGITYKNLPTGDPAANVQKAIDCLRAALEVFTEEEYPERWAMTLNNLGNAYADVMSGDRSQNLLQAIACFEDALRVYIRQVYTSDWASIQNNLGNIYRVLPTGDRSANVKKAIACYEAALEVRTEQDFPYKWATTQNNLGNAYKNLPCGDQHANLQAAVAHYEAAMRVWTEQDFPHEWALVQSNLALALSETGDRERAKHLFQSAARGYRQIGLEEKACTVEEALALLSK